VDHLRGGHSRHAAPPEILNRQRIHATFLFTADAAQAHPEVVRSGVQRRPRDRLPRLHHEFLGEANSDTPGLFTLLRKRSIIGSNWRPRSWPGVAGVRPVSFRCPRLQSSNQVLAALERLGYTVDGSYPTYFYGEQLAPYYPAARSWRKAGRCACWSCRPSPTSRAGPARRGRLLARARLLAEAAAGRGGPLQGAG